MAEIHLQKKNRLATQSGSRSKRGTGKLVSRAGLKSGGGSGFKSSNGSGSRAQRQSSVRTSWDPLAQWYDGWMGQEGSKHHQLVLPTVLELLEIRAGDRVLDLGCGQGVLAEAVAERQGTFVGVDASPQLIEIAKKRHGNKGTFLVGDVTKLASVEGVTAESFNAVVFLLSIQDIESLPRAIANAATALQVDGKLVILMLHPAFRIARQSGWGFDEQRKLRYRRVDQYLSPNKIPLKEYPGKQKGVSFTFHRPLQEYFAVLKQAGLVVDDLRELSTSAWITDQTPRAEARAAREIPLFLALRALKMR